MEWCIVWNKTGQSSKVDLAQDLALVSSSPAAACATHGNPLLSEVSRSAHVAKCFRSNFQCICSSVHRTELNWTPLALGGDISSYGATCRMMPYQSVGHSLEPDESFLFGIVRKLVPCRRQWGLRKSQLRKSQYRKLQLRKFDKLGTHTVWI